jgi:hypothetical protein
MKSTGVSGGAALFEAECLFDFFFVNAAVLCYFDQCIASPEATNNYLCGYGPTSDNTGRPKESRESMTM